MSEIFGCPEYFGCLNVVHVAYVCFVHVVYVCMLHTCACVHVVVVKGGNSSRFRDWNSSKFRGWNASTLVKYICIRTCITKKLDPRIA